MSMFQATQINIIKELILLVLTRKLGEKIQIGDDISILIMEIKGKQVRLGIEAPSTVKIHREEIYQKIQDEVEQSEIAEIEMKAKDAYYRFFDAKAFEFYTDWLTKEPDNLEALFDLAQSYSRQMQWDNAQKTYNRTLRVMDSHFRAKQAGNKTKIFFN